VRETLRPLDPGGPEQTARDVVEDLGLDVPPADGRPRVLAAMIASADGRAAVQGSSAGLGHPADRALLRELRTAVDAILVGPGTLRAEGYAELLDARQRERRVARGLDAQPIVTTVTRSGDVPIEIGLFGEPDARTKSTPSRPSTSTVAARASRSSDYRPAAPRLSRCWGTSRASSACARCCARAARRCCGRSSAGAASTTCCSRWPPCSWQATGPP
jgi:hypothetical protein